MTILIDFVQNLRLPKAAQKVLTRQKSAIAESIEAI